MNNQDLTCPTFMEEDVCELEFELPQKARDRVWDCLQLRETFTHGQIFPYSVEFISGELAGSFVPGEKNIHHGPLLHLPGEIGTITDTYRSLFYYYGIYVLSFRLVRPLFLEFFKTDTGIRMKLKSFVRPFFRPIWRFANKFFWKNFGIKFLFKS
ncbi:MAG: hypothetical protein AB8G05_17690 [Oligoflexales bacterium]